MVAPVLLLLLMLPGLALAQVSIVSSKHNLSSSGTGSIKASSESQVCVFCHTPHGSSSIAQLWNKQTTSASYTLYSSDYITSLPSYPAPAQPKTRSKLCLSCHDGTVALGSVYNLPGSGGGSGGTIAMTEGGSAITTMPTGAAGYLGTTLTDDHPVGYMYNTTSDAELVVRGWPWGTAVKLDPDASTGTVECQTCHEPHNNQFTKFLRVSNANAALCTFCHNKTGYAVSGHPNATTESYTPAGGTATNVGEYSCRSCHKPHSSGGTPYILRGAEENTCYERGCHGNNTNNTDPSTPATPAARQIQDELSKVHAHPVNTFSGRHKNVSGGESQTQLGGAGAANRHAECMDCHNPHQVQPAVVKASRAGLRISAALKGVWGVEPTWPSPPTTMTTNVVTFAPIVTYTKVPAPTDEYQVCLKCHSNYVTLPAGARNVAQEINPLNSSYHGIVPGGVQNLAIAANPTALLKQPWATSQRVWCSDCHGRQTTTPPNPTHTRPYGPHGSSLNGTGPGTSNTDKMLVATIVLEATNGGTPLCLVCHQEAATRDGDANGLSNNSRHGPDTSPSRAPEGCFSCHMWENPATVTGGTGDIFPHGMNKRWALVGLGPDTGSTQLVEKFNGGWYTNMDYGAKQCWTSANLDGRGNPRMPAGSPCNNHAGENY